MERKSLSKLRCPLPGQERLYTSEPPCIGVWQMYRTTGQKVLGCHGIQITKHESHSHHYWRRIPPTQSLGVHCPSGPTGQRNSVSVGASFILRVPWGFASHSLISVEAPYCPSLDSGIPISAGNLSASGCLLDHRLDKWIPDFL